MAYKGTDDDRDRARMTDAADSLRVLAELNRSLATFADLDELVHFATGRTRELFDAEGCALLLLDRARREFSFPVASQREAVAISEAALQEVRFPADRGIAGWVLTQGESTAVPDTASDPRFFDAVDRRTTMRTRSLLCAPLRTRTGNIGVIEVVNPAADRLGPDDVQFLDALASAIGVAYEKQALYRDVEREIVDLRRFCGGSGLALALVGVLLALGTAFFHRARVLPWSDLPAQRGMLLGGLCLFLGGLLYGIGRGWFVSRPARP